MGSDCGINVLVVSEQDVVTTGGAFYLDGDADDSQTTDTVNRVRFTDGITLTAATMLTLESASGSIMPAGSLSLHAGAGVIMEDDLNSNANGEALPPCHGPVRTLWSAPL